MTSKPMSQLLVDLGVARSHSRPHVSNDNLYSEAQFKTLKYCPAFPDRFGSIADARAFCVEFFDHYNHTHRHSGIGLHTPGLGPLRHRHRDQRTTRRHPRWRLRHEPSTVPTSPARTPEAVHRRMDQRTPMQALIHSKKKEMCQTA